MHLRRLAVPCLFILALLQSQDLSAQAEDDTVRVMAYNLLNFPDPVPAGRADTLRKVFDQLQADLLLLSEIKSEFGAQTLLDKALNADGIIIYKRADFVPNQSSPGTGALQQTLLYNKNRFVLSDQQTHRTPVRDINEYTLYMRDPWLNAHGDTLWLDVYVVHLKAGNSPPDAALRAIMADTLSGIINARGPGRNVIVGGDFNLYSSTEAAWLTLTDLFNPVILKDPLDAAGSWSGNFTLRYTHTQSTRTSAIFGDGSGGGLDDRFDFLLLSNNLLNGVSRIQYLPNSYETPGNDGECYNESILDCNGSPVPLPVRRAMYYASDHLPVVLDLRVDYPELTGVSTAAGGSLHLVVTRTTESQIHFEFEAPAGMPLNAALYDASGRLYWKDDLYGTGHPQQVSLDIPLAPGLSLLRLQNASHSLTRRVLRP